MGWTGVTEYPDFETCFKGEFVKPQPWGPPTTCLGYAFVGSVCYSVFEQLVAGKPDRFGMVCLFGRNGAEILYKEIPEDSGPAYYDMPGNLFSLLLNFPRSGYSPGWRAEVQKRLAP